jgi:hypothetical protein
MRDYREKWMEVNRDSFGLWLYSEFGVMNSECVEFRRTAKTSALGIPALVVRRPWSIFDDRSIVDFASP